MFTNRDRAEMKGSNRWDLLPVANPSRSKTNNLDLGQEIKAWDNIEVLPSRKEMEAQKAEYQAKRNVEISDFLMEDLASKMNQGNISNDKAAHIIVQEFGKQAISYLDQHWDRLMGNEIFCLATGAKLILTRTGEWRVEGYQGIHGSDVKPYLG